MRGRTLRCMLERQQRLQQELAVVSERLALIARERELAKTSKLQALDRVLAVLTRHPELTFTPGELTGCVGAGEQTVATALTRLVRAGKVERAAHATYRIAR